MKPLNRLARKSFITGGGSYRGISPPLPDAPASLHREARYRHVSLTDLPGEKVWK